MTHKQKITVGTVVKKRDKSLLCGRRFSSLSFFFFERNFCSKYLDTHVLANTGKNGEISNKATVYFSTEEPSHSWSIGAKQCETTHNKKFESNFQKPAFSWNWEKMDFSMQIIHFSNYAEVTKLWNFTFYSTSVCL